MTNMPPSPDTVADTLVYVYGVAHSRQACEAAPLDVEGIIPGALVRRLVHDDLVAFISLVPTRQFGASELQVALADAEWTKERILAHERVVEKLRPNGDLVPFRFCTIYRDASRVSDALARHEIELKRTIDRVRHASEWGVKLYCDLQALRRAIEGASHAMRDLRMTMTGASPGAEFFMHKKYVKALESEVAAAIARCIEQTQRRFESCARESAETPVQPSSVHGRPEDMVMNAAYLVGEDAFDRFVLILAALRDEFAAQGFGYDLTGPWPPYHFVLSQHEGVRDGAGSGE